MKILLHTLLVFCALISANSNAQQMDMNFGVNGLLPYVHPANLNIPANQSPTLNSRGNSGSGNATVIQPDGKIVTATSTAASSTNDWYMYVFRYLPNGMPDTTFGVKGVSGLFCGDGTNAYDLQYLPDGKILVIGESKYCRNGICGYSQIFLMRILSNGELDTSFGVTGHITNLEIYGDLAAYAIGYKLELLPNGKIMIGVKGANGNPKIMRLQEDGFPDLTFGTNGWFEFARTFTDFVDFEVDEQGNTYLLSTTRTMDPTTYQYDSTRYSYGTLTKINASGNLDTSFGTNGLIDFNADVSDIPTAILLTSNNQLIVTGHTMAIHRQHTTVNFSGLGLYNRGFIGHFTIDGTLDTSILPTGYKQFVFPEDSAVHLTNIKELSDGRYYLCGRTFSIIGTGYFEDKSLIMALNHQLNLDPTFAETGYMVFNHGTPYPTSPGQKIAEFKDIDLTPENDIILTGRRNAQAGSSRIAVYLLKLLMGDESNLSTENITFMEESLIYPNPVINNQFTVESKSDAQLRIMSIDGQVIHEENIPAGTSSITLTPSFSGMAIVELNTISGARKLEKIIIH